MKASKFLISFVEKTREGLRCEYGAGWIGVCYQNCEIKEGDFLISRIGRGQTFEEACEDYLTQIRGKTLVFNAYSSKRREVKVLC